MALSQTLYDEHEDALENSITAKNLEFPPPFPPTEDTWAEARGPARDKFEECVLAVVADTAVHADVFTTDANGHATLTYPPMANPVILTSAVDAAVDNVYRFVVVESVSATQATVRVTNSTALQVLGLAVLSVPSAAAGVTVHIAAVPGEA